MNNNILQERRYFILEDKEEIYKQNGRYIKIVNNKKVTFNKSGANIDGIRCDIVTNDEFRYLQSNVTFGKLYFCQGCKYFTAMVENDDVTGLEGAECLDRPDLFVLTHCINKYNREESEGNTNQNACPLEKFKK